MVRMVTNGKESAPIASVRMPAGFTSLGAEHAIKIAAIGDKHVITVDGQQVLAFTNATYASGGVGTRSWGTGNSAASPASR